MYFYCPGHVITRPRLIELAAPIVLGLGTGREIDMNVVGNARKLATNAGEVGVGEIVVTGIALAKDLTGTGIMTGNAIGREDEKAKDIGEIGSVTGTANARIGTTGSVGASAKTRWTTLLTTG
jgi:hypothetical protein